MQAQISNAIQSKPWNITGAIIAGAGALLMLLFAILPWGKIKASDISLSSNGFALIGGGKGDNTVAPDIFLFYIAGPVALSIILIVAGAVMLLLNKNTKLAAALATGGAGLGTAFSLLYIISGAKMDFTLGMLSLSATAYSSIYGRDSDIITPNLSYGVILYFLISAALAAFGAFIFLKKSDIFSQTAVAPQQTQQSFPSAFPGQTGAAGQSARPFQPGQPSQQGQPSQPGQSQQ